MRTVALFGIITVVLRAATLIFQSLVIGGVVFHRWVRPAAMPDFAAEAPARAGRLGVRLIRGAAIALAITQVLYLGINSYLISSSVGLDLGQIIGANFFIAGLITIAAAVGIACFPARRLRHPGNLVAALSLVVLACGVLANHAFSRMEGRTFLVIATAVHQSAAAVWIGGLPQLWISLHTSDAGWKSSTAWRFSRLALLSVAALLGSGIAMAIRYIDSPRAMYGTSYGIMLGVKILFFLVLVGIGAMNRKLLRSLDRQEPRLLLRRLLEAEIGIGITAILAAASLTSQPPAADLKVGRVTGVEIYDRVKPLWPRFSSPKLDEVSPSSLQATKRAQEAGKPRPFIPFQNTNADIAWSEYNHHWAGLFVLLLGLLAALAQRRRAGIARYWPLLFAGLAVFIFLRADPEGWPLGPDNFWEAIQDGEVMQHKVFALLIVLFAIFELRVQLGKTRFRAAYYVFPAVCALGGALLLTHSHALSNIKEELLAELSHAPIAIAAVLAGWSRWLQVRLPGNQLGVATRIWPACFVAIGVILLNYREA